MNMTNRFSMLVLAVAGTVALPAAAQIMPPIPSGPPPTPAQLAAFRQAYTASMKVQHEVTVDRQQYLAGEVVRATLSVFNPTSDSLVVFDPFEVGAGCLRLGVKLEGADPAGPWGGTSSEPTCEGLDESAPTITLGPGERIEKTIPSAELAWKVHPEPTSAGRYRLSFCYRNRAASCAHTEFTVVVPIFRGSAAVMLAEPGKMQYAKDGPVTQYSRYIQAFILECDGKRYIGLQRWPESFEPRLYLTQGRKLDGGRAQFLGAFDRIAEAGMDANSLQLEADAQENITVTWNESGQARSHCVSSDRTRIESCKASLVPPVQISIDPPTKTLGVSESKHFLVGIAGTSNTAVKWSIALGPDAPAGAEPGTISADGVYEAPHSIPSPYTVIVTARSQADRTKSTSATVTLAPR
jgi:hypothetical protein